MKHVVMFSGGAGSWATARRVIDRGIDPVLLFADTRMEDEDLYRFLSDCERDLGRPVTRIAEGRTPWEVFRDRRFLGNSRVDPCSEALKREPIKRWLAQHCDPADTVCYVGIDWTEEHRYTRLKARHAEQGWRYEAPLCEAPFLSKDDVLRALRERGIEPPRLYALGFPHNNCGGFCVKAGQAHFRNLLKQLPERYAYHEAQEEALRAHLGKDVAILTDRTGGKRKPLPLAEFRKRQEFDPYEWGGCGCFGGDADGGG